MTETLQVCEPDLTSWTVVTLADCVYILDSHREPINNTERQERISGKSQQELFPYYGATGQVGWIDDYIFDRELLLLGEDGVPFLESGKAKAYLVNGKSWINNHAHVLDAVESLTTNKFLLYFLNQFDFHGYVTGTTRLKLNQSRMREIPVALPPLNEQRRIVEKIEELFTRLDAGGVEALKHAQVQLKKYRQSVLNAAVTGELSREWRNARTDELEPASELLKRILEERRDSGSTDEGDEELPLLPSKWLWSSIGQLGSVTGGLTKNKQRAALSQTLPYLRVANVYANELKLEDVSEIGVRESEVERVLLEQEDLLVVEGNGSPDQIGRVAVWDGSISPCVHQNHLIKVRFFPNSISRWALTWLLSIQGREHIERVASSTSGLHTLSLSKVRNLAVPLPPLEEQRYLVEEVERRFSVIDHLEATIEDSLKRSGSLRQSILKRAFSGRLVEQDPDDEPASALLERIREERLATNQKGKKRKPKKDDAAPKPSLFAEPEG